MEKRYQVFVSSTYADLTEERKAIIQAILNLNQLPAGMEMFPAANDDQWTLIKRVIDESDYYVVVVAGRYGSVGEEGISYTEREYDYAVETGTPILGFVHREPGKIQVDKTDQNDQKRERLDAFRAKVETRMVKHFTSAAELGGHVTTGLVHLINTAPAVGWVRGDRAMTIETEREILQLREQLSAAEAAQVEARTALVEDVSDLEQGNDLVSANVTFTGYLEGSRMTKTVLADSTWDALFGEIAPVMIDEAPEREVRNRVSLTFASIVAENEYKELKNWGSKGWDISTDDWEAIKIQYRALGLIDVGQKRRQINDKNKYLRLTDRGDRHLVFLRAARRS